MHAYTIFSKPKPTTKQRTYYCRDCGSWVGLGGIGPIVILSVQFTRVIYIHSRFTFRETTSRISPRSGPHNYHWRSRGKSAHNFHFVFNFIFSLLFRNPGLLSQFIADLHSGKLHREYHYSPSREATSLIRPHFHCRRGGLNKMG
jgi:hypothetical protein